MGDAFCFGESAIFARSKKELPVAAPSGSRAHDNCRPGDLCYNPKTHTESRFSSLDGKMMTRDEMNIE